ncbi:hypothetical protein [Bradyrhizobium sp. OK095]|jgi:hypothetical protein|uniref:hypothetical protein n=1 Tax=Bradyrhizobium sp. OK095 TaxID=1882760 RepID=UPI0008CADCB8|nr:hypothetical protein [Bradyrhizobium sp. OK095]SEM20464.1 hypothetical protein SAMN05443254_101125 [Bradyrhizobium sp. OK095]
MKLVISLPNIGPCWTAMHQAFCLTQIDVQGFAQNRDALNLVASLGSKIGYQVFFAIPGDDHFLASVDQFGPRLHGVESPEKP